MKMNKKVVLAYSGGLDTTYCAVYLRELGYDVHAIAVDTGGFDDDEKERIIRKARDIGVEHVEIINATERFYQECIRFMIFGNVLRNNTYPLSVSAERLFQSMEIAEYALKNGADAIAHGSTGAGNDQVRFDAAFQLLCPDIEIITPIRDNRLSREEEIEYLSNHGINMSWEKAKYSINKGIWGTSVGGAETLTSHQYLPDQAFPSQPYKKSPEKLAVTFESGEPVALNQEKMMPVEVIRELNKAGHAFGIGRDIHVGDTIIGIKGRVGFEAPAALMTIKAHQLLEKHVLSKWQMYWKDHLAQWYGMFVHEAQFMDPVMRNIEAFLSDSQRRVSGEVFLTLYPGYFICEGIDSRYDLMKSSFGQYGEMNNAWSGEDVKGFTKIFSNATNIYLNGIKDD